MTECHISGQMEREGNEELVEQQAQQFSEWLVGKLTGPDATQLASGFTLGELLDLCEQAGETLSGFAESGAIEAAGLKSVYQRVARAYWRDRGHLLALMLYSRFGQEREGC